MTLRLLPWALLGILIPVTGATGWGSASPAGTSSPHERSQVEHYRQALAIDPENHSLRYQLGLALRLTGAERDAATEFRRAYSTLSEQVETNLDLGLACWHTGDPDSALLYLGQAETLSGSNPAERYPLADAYFHLAHIYLDNGHTAEGIRLLRRVLELEPGRIDIRRILGEIYAHRDETDQALVEFAFYLQSYPDDETTREYVFALHYHRGLQWMEQNRWAEAEGAFAEALRLSPDSPLVQYYLGQIQYTSGRVAEAAESLRSALQTGNSKIQSSAHDLLFNCSLALFESGQLRRALIAIEPLVQHPTATAEVLAQAGHIHFALKEYESALGYYQRTLTLEPNHHLALQNRPAAQKGAVRELLARGNSLAQAEDFVAAVATLEQGLGIEPNDARLRAVLLQTQVAKKRKAADLFADARQARAESQPRLGLTLVRKGLGLLDSSAEGLLLQEQLLAELAQPIAQSLEKSDELLVQGRLQEARESFSQVLILDPENRRALQGLHTISMQIQVAYALALDCGEQALEEGRLDAARQAFGEALQLRPDSAEGADGLRRAEGLTDALSAEELQAGRRALGRGQLDAAKAHFAKAFSFRNEPIAHSELAKVEAAIAEQQSVLLQAARTAVASGNYTRARNLYGRILARYPDHATARQELTSLHQQTAVTVLAAVAKGETDLAANRISAAVAEFRRALEIDPANPDGQRGLADSRLRLQNELSRLTAEAKHALEEKDLDQAERLLRAALGLDPYHAEAQALLQRLADPYRTSYRPGDEEQLYGTGLELYTRGRYAQAAEVWQQVLLLTPAHEKARLGIEIAKRKMQQIRDPKII
ncbi:MAG: tetratricopeptide repeat protein [Desulfuromonadales bacterium]